MKLTVQERLTVVLFPFVDGFMRIRKERGAKRNERAFIREREGDMERGEGVVTREHCPLHASTTEQNTITISHQLSATQIQKDQYAVTTSAIITYAGARKSNSTPIP
ncbi:hypothetical protein O0L34_g13092 [Tuta absoluta]|nr:hypothetical protein O0L34_g13092 [Tuta absoluta]